MSFLIFNRPLHMLTRTMRYWWRMNSWISCSFPFPCVFATLFPFAFAFPFHLALDVVIISVDVSARTGSLMGVKSIPSPRISRVRTRRTCYSLMPVVGRGLAVRVCEFMNMVAPRAFPFATDWGGLVDMLYRRKRLLWVLLRVRVS
jgi:hypothetical protein